MNISLKCPHCGGELAAASAEGLENKNATCPQCKQTFAIKEFIPKYSLKVDGRNHQLHFGRQWIGRQCEGSGADVQIPDDTRYMSRKHALIELHCTATGIECTFEEHGKNPTTKDGVELMEDDIIYISANDCLQLGSRKMYLANEYEQ